MTSKDNAHDTNNVHGKTNIHDKTNTKDSTINNPYRDLYINLKALITTLIIKSNMVIDYGYIRKLYKRFKKQINKYYAKMVLEIAPLGLELFLILFGSIYVRVWLVLMMSLNIYNIYTLLTHVDESIKDDILLGYFVLIALVIIGSIISIIYGGMISALSLSTLAICSSLVRSYNLMKRLR